MYRACIAVADASRARLFTYERVANELGVSEQLIEQRDLVHPARRLRPAALFSDSRPGSSRTGNLQYGFDDHRDAHVEQLDAAFARSIIGELQDLLMSHELSKLILCASPHMLGALREAGHELLREPIEVAELARDFVKLTPPELRAQLAAHGLLPAQPARAAARPG